MMASLTWISKLFYGLIRCNKLIYSKIINFGAFFSLAARSDASFAANKSRVHCSITPTARNNSWIAYCIISIHYLIKIKKENYFVRDINFDFINFFGVNDLFNNNSNPFIFTFDIFNFSINSISIIRIKFNNFKKSF